MGDSAREMHLLSLFTDEEPEACDGGFFPGHRAPVLEGVLVHPISQISRAPGPAS